MTTHDDVQKSHDSQVGINDLHSSLGPEILLLEELWRGEDGKMREEEEEERREKKGVKGESREGEEGGRRERERRGRNTHVQGQERERQVSFHCSWAEEVVEAHTLHLPHHLETDREREIHAQQLTYICCMIHITWLLHVPIIHIHWTNHSHTLKLYGPIISIHCLKQCSE